jgi:GGDEF domain-containing protein
MTAGVNGITNLLRLARAQFRAAAAFAVVARDGREPEMVFVPSDCGEGALPGEALALLARQASLDPELGHAGAFVRSVQLTGAMTLVVAPVPGPGGRGLLGVVGPEVDGSERAQLDLLERLAQRLTRHAQALHAVEERRAASAEQSQRTNGRQGDGAPAPIAPGGPPVPSEPPDPSAPRPPLEPPLPGPPAVAPLAPAAPGPAPARTPPVTATEEHRAPAPPSSWWAPSDPLTGLPSMAQFFSRAGRLLGSEARASGAVAVVLVEVPSERTAAAAARALAAQLRCSDPLARIDHDLFAAAVLLFPGSTRGDAVEERLGGAVRAALDWLAPVRTAHVLAEPGDRRDIDELLRQAIAGLPGRGIAPR